MSFIYKIDYVCCKKHFEMWLISFSDVGSVKKNYLKNKIAFKKKNFIAFIIVKI